MDQQEQLSAVAARSPNFGRLLEHEPLLLGYGAAAESVIFDDPNTALIKSRQFGEGLAEALVVRMGLKVDGERQVDRLRALTDAGALTPKVDAAFDFVRTAGNQAVHEHLADVGTALQAIERCFRLGEWFYRALTGSREQIAFIAPQPNTPETAPPDVRAELSRYGEELVEVRTRLESEQSRTEAEAVARRAAEAELDAAKAHQHQLRGMVEQLESQLASLQYDLSGRAANPDTVAAKSRNAFIDRARRASRTPLTEHQTRESIDAMLQAAGWVVQDADKVNLYERRGVAVREVTLATGRVDYLLYVDRAIVGVVEAKREGTALAAVSEQSTEYAEYLTSGQRLQAWRTPLPLRYESTGVETWFTNRLDPRPRAREVFGFHQPDTIAAWISEQKADPDAPTYRARLRSRLPELGVAGLRPAQVDAVKGVEKALAHDKPRSLVQMATGAGKTYMAVTFGYRLIKHAKARRILFLVDRNNLGKQAYAEFCNYTTPDDGRKFSEIYGVQRLSGSTVLDSANVVISTVQRLYGLLRGQPLPDDDTDPEDDDLTAPIEVSYNVEIPPETFDLIVVDECHRSVYGRWRGVLEYFDAHLIGLTATPVAITFGFFQELVSEYTYQQAVADGVNVDFDVYRIRTELGEQGGTIPADTVVPVRDRRTRRQRYQELDDDFDYTSKQLGRSVISMGQLRLVLQTFEERVFTDIFPGRSTVPKTLIFAKDDNHADEIVHLVREIFDTDNDFCTKITYSARNPDELLAKLRNSPDLRVAVTVDMIATGTDVRALECVFFLRDVQSWAYFEQMKGRGARTIDAAEYRAVTPDAHRKDRFVIVDAVGVTDSPRVDAAPLQRANANQVSLEQLLGKAANMTINQEEVSTLASRLARLDQQIDDDERAELAKVAGRSLADVTRGLVDAIDVDAQTAAGEEGGEQAQRALIEQAVRPLAENKVLRDRILEIRRAHDIVYDEVNPDRVLSVEAKTFDEDDPKHTIESWQQWLSDNADEVNALRIAFDQRRDDPKAVYDALDELARRIARPPHRWTPSKLWDAYEKLGMTSGNGKSGIAELVSILRYELGMVDELAPFRSRVEENLAGWLARQEQAGVSFTGDQRWWIDRIVEVMISGVCVSHEVLDDTPFADRGGVEGFLDTFGDDRAETLLDELNEELPA